MVRSLYFDSHRPKPITQAFGDDVSDLLMMPTGGGSSFASAITSKNRRGGEQDSYKLANYLAVYRIALKFSQQFPMVGAVMPITPDRRQAVGIETQGKLSLKQQDWIRRYYGGTIVMQNVGRNEEIELLESGHPLIDLLRMVNPIDWWGSFSFENAMYWRLMGEYFIWMAPSKTPSAIRGVSQPAQLWSIPPQWVELKYAKSGKLVAYRITPGGDTRRRRDLPPEQVIHGMDKNPFSKQRGYSPSVAGGSWLDSAVAIEKSRIHAFENSVDPSLWLKITDDEMDPQDPVLDAVKEKIIQRMSGVTRHREPQIIPPGFELDDTGAIHPKEMDYSNSSAEARNNTLALHGVNKFIAGFTEDLNLAQVREAMTHFCEIVLNPMLRTYSSALQERLAPLYDERIRLWFGDCAPRNRELELQELALRADNGAATPNEIRQAFGDDVIQDPDYDTGYIGAGRVPLGQNPLDGLEDEGDEDEQAVAESMYQGNGHGRQALIDALDK